MNGKFRTKNGKMKVAFLTLGCKVNYYETEKMMAELQRHGFEVTDFNSHADVYIVNTCTVTNIADRKSRKMLHRARKNNPDSIVAAVGCYVESGGEELKKDGAVDLFFSNAEKSQIAQKLIAYLKETGRWDEVKWDADDMEELHAMSGGRTRKYIKVQDGCNQFCSYCMIPYVRGGGILSSRSEEDVLEEVHRLAADGWKEVVITGIHLSSYGVERSGGHSFVEGKGAPLVALLQRINEVSGIERIRLGSLEPRIICDEFMDGLAGIHKLCPHFHLSLQSGCDATLKRMNRHYTAGEYKACCGRIRDFFENPAITTDVIVGFPGETEEEFEETRRFVREVGLADVHVFPYSVRNGTKAARMENQVSPEIRHHRAEILLQEAARLREAYAAAFIGKRERVLFEEIRNMDGEDFLVGHNERYVLFRVPMSEAASCGFRKNEIRSVAIGEENLFEFL